MVWNEEIQLEMSDLGFFNGILTDAKKIRGGFELCSKHVFETELSLVDCVDWSPISPKKSGTRSIEIAVEICYWMLLDVTGLYLSMTGISGI